MPYKEKEIEKLYWSISEVAEIMGVTMSMLRFWETEFEVIQPKKNKKGDRFYTAKDIEILKTVKHLVKEKGYTLKGAKDKLKNKQSESESQYMVVESLKKIRGFLVQLRDEM